MFLINTLRDGGAEKILVDIVNHLNPDIYNIEIRLIYKKGVYFDTLNNNIKVSYISGPPRSFWATQVSRMLPRLPSKILHWLFIRKKYDVEVAFLEGYATKIIAGGQNKIKKLAWVHCDLTKTEWIDGVYKTNDGFIKCYQQFDKIVCVSESVKEAFVERFGTFKNLTVKYNPVADNRIRELSLMKSPIKRKEGTITIISMGRMTYPKNFFRLLKSVNNLLKLGYKIELWLLGDGEELEKLKKYVIEHGIQEFVHFTGYVKNPYPYLRNSDLYVCSSIYEGFSTAATEALVIGIPVLTTNVAGMHEMLGENQYGIITENNDQAFEEGLKNILDNPDLLYYYRMKAKERSSYFEMKSRLKEIEKIL